jgi:hypothetical protein
MKKVILSIALLSIVSLGIYSCNKEEVKTQATSKYPHKHWGEWTGETQSEKKLVVDGVYTYVDCDQKGTEMCYRYVGGGRDQYIGKTDILKPKGWYFTLAIINADFLTIKPFAFKDAATESAFLAQTKYVVSEDQVLDGFNLSGVNEGKKIVLKKGSYDIMPPLSAEDKAYIQINYQLID